MLPYIRRGTVYLVLLYTNFKMRPGGAFLFSEAREALLPGGTTIYVPDTKEDAPE